MSRALGTLERVGLLADVNKVGTLVRKAVARRTAVREVRAALRADPPLPTRRFQIAIYFADGDVNMYQIRQWYAPLAKVAATWPVLVISRTATGAKAILQDGALPVAFAPTVRDVERVIARQDIRIVLYVNQNTRNFQMFRYGHCWHVFINHGESDKMYMTTNQFKAYDYAFVAGDAARERLSRVLWNYDLDARTFAIGRPQADHVAGALPFSPDHRTVVLYAPTWEGDRPSAHYGSVLSHGESVVAQVLASPDHRLIYRPHPRSGVVRPEYGEANRRIIRAIATANSADASAGHVYDDKPELGWQLDCADVAIVDISAMIYDRLALGKPLIVTRPIDPRAAIDQSGYLSACEWLEAATAPAVLRQAHTLLNDPDAVSRLQRWVRHYFGDTAPGSATTRFHDALQTLMQGWESWNERTPKPVPIESEQEEESPL